MMTEAMEFPKTFDEFVNSYGLVDTEEVYTNGSQLIPVFRVKQWLEHISAKTQMIDKSNFDAEQYKTDLQSAYDCGYNKALSENKREFDGMTNGEVMQTFFDGLIIHDNPAMRKYTIPMTYEFWNAPYQKGGEE